MSGIVEQTITIPVSGGRKLSARLWRPKQDGRWPAILDAAPYRAGDLFRPLVDAQLPYFAAHGYAALAIDIAGSGNATGILRDEYTPTEIDDLAQAIAWCARQDWCDGGVGLTGFSWAAFAALRTSAKAPPALKAMVLGGVSEDGWRTDIHNLGGALYTAQVDWAGVMLMLNALPPDPAQFDGDWRVAWKERLEANMPWIVPWLEHPAHDAYWTDKATSAAGTIPLLLYAGLADKYATSVLRIAAGRRGPVRTIIGPWEHALPNVAARGPCIGYLQEALRWFDKFLKGRETGALDAPPLRLWLAAPDAQGDLADGAWVAMDWPQKPGGAMAFALRDGALVRDGEPDGAPIELTSLRANPHALAADLYEDVPAIFDYERAKDLGALVAFSEPFDADHAVGMSPVLRLRCEARRGVLVARLLDIAPDGTAIRMTTGAMNLALSNNDVVALPFQAMAWRMKAGHRLGLVLSCDGWPTFWPARESADGLVVREMTLDVPLVAEHADTPSFEPAITAPAPRPETLKWIEPSRETLPPRATGAVSHAGISAAHHLGATGTDYYIASRFDIAPLGISDARAAKCYRVAFERPDWSVRLDVALEVRSTPQAFHIAWRITAWEGAAVFHDVVRETSVPRTIA